MCSGSEQSDSDTKSSMKDMSKEEFFSSLLELAANNDMDGFKRSVECDSSAIDSVGLWLVRKKGSKQVVNEERTPLMVAATYGSIDVLKLILSRPEVDVNRACGPDKVTALHCATSGGSVDAVEVVKLLLLAGADPIAEDVNGQRPGDVIAVPPKLPGGRASLEELLLSNTSDDSVGSVGECNLVGSGTTSNASSPILSSSPDNGSPVNSAPEKKEYPVDPSLPDIKNSIYSTDEFRMFSFKVRPCSRAYSHDWTECPFVHPGENARRRDPRKFHYSCVPCPEFRKGACRRGDLCEYAHGVFECWLHPAQYRTRLCKDGTACARRVCFFAHKPEELRPLYVSTGSAVPSPRSTVATASVMDMAAALNLLPGSPSHSFNQPMSPSSSSVGWPQPNVPTLQLPASNFQSSRLRSSLCARDIQPEDFEAQQLLLNELACFSPQPRCRSKTTLTPSNLDDLFSNEVVNSSPRYADQTAALASSSGVFSPSHKSAVFTQLQQQQRMLSPINTNVFSPKNVDQHPRLHSPFAAAVSSPGRMSPRSVDPISPMSTRLSPFAQPEKQLRSFSSRDLGSNNPSIVGSSSAAGNNSWSNLGSLNANVDWSLNGDKMRHHPGWSFEQLNNNGEGPVAGPGPNLSWVQSLVKESPPGMMKKESAGDPAPSGEGLKSEFDFAALGALLEKMQLDQLVA